MVDITQVEVRFGLARLGLVRFGRRCCLQYNFVFKFDFLNVISKQILLLKTVNQVLGLDSVCLPCAISSCILSQFIVRMVDFKSMIAIFITRKEKKTRNISSVHCKLLLYTDFHQKIASLDQNLLAYNQSGSLKISICINDVGYNHRD